MSFHSCFAYYNISKETFYCCSTENENSVSVVDEKKVVGALQLKEGTTVDILTGTNKGLVAICKATILKVCGEWKLRYSLRDQNLVKEYI